MTPEVIHRNSIAGNAHCRGFTFHVLAVRAIASDTVNLPPERYAMILCSTHIERLKKAAQYAENCLIADFADLTDPTRSDTFHPEHAQGIKQFVASLSPQVTDLFICCDYGESRSPAIMAALLLASGKSDYRVWNNPHYHPNPLVFRELCLVYGIFMPEWKVRARVQISEEAFHNAVTNGSAN